jgi:hypothetical protein
VRLGYQDQSALADPKVGVLSIIPMSPSYATAMASIPDLRSAIARNVCSRWCVGHSDRADLATARRSQHPGNALQHASIINPWHAVRLGQQRLDHTPFEVGQIVSAHADVESEPECRGKMLLSVYVLTLEPTDP